MHYPGRFEFKIDKLSKSLLQPPTALPDRTQEYSGSVGIETPCAYIVLA